jgi:hypothetical protein
MRTGWDRRHAKLTALYDGDTVRLELESAAGVLCSGAWQFQVLSDGRPLRPISNWENTCWFSDQEIDYLELEIALSEEVRIQRHLALCRSDGFALLADAVLAPRQSQLEYQGRLPLSGQMRFEAAAETREGLIVSPRPAALVLPLVLPEWQSDPHEGLLWQAEGDLVLRQAMAGGAIFAPLFIDLQPSRLTKPCTWRQLTVAENRRALSQDAAAGFRVMVGRQQWLVYRSLGPTGNRTLMGHNLITEFLLARFRQDGEIESLVEIE